MFEVDPRFRQGRKAAKSRHLKRRALRIGLFGLLPLLTVSVAAWAFTDLPGRLGSYTAGWLGHSDDDEMLVQLDEAADIAPAIRADVFLDIAGDPSVLRFDETDRAVSTGQAEGSGVLDVQRFGLPRPGRFTIIRDDLIKTEQRLMIQLPSSREDFATFVADRDRAQAEASQRASEQDAALQEELANLATLPEITDEITDDITDGGGDLELTGLEDDAHIDGDPADGAGLIAATAPAQNTTSVTSVRREAERRPLYRDAAIRITLARPPAEVLADNGLSETEAAAALATLAPILPLPDPLPRDAVLGLRLLPGPAGSERLSQVSLYLGDNLVGTALLDGRGGAVASTDPWLGRDLPALARAAAGDGASDGKEDGEGRYRLLDAIYSAALRDGVPAALAGELITILSQSVDLERRATGGDRLTLVFSTSHGPGGKPGGQWLYVGTEGPSGKIDCYVMSDKSGGFRCATLAGTAQAAVGGSGALLQSPVNGVMTSRFGPRNHPILKKTRLHAGVDWAAPVGTEIRAAAAGKVVKAGDGSGYGNLVVLAHPDGFETRYAHMQRFAPGLKPGDIVQAGQAIGTVGLTGLTTGAHLHFELRQNGEPVDPMPWLTGGAAVAGSDAVEELVAQIIKVESGNNATAKNPNSTATGLGQFVERTWLQMMRRYRPELVASMTTAEVLALRNDPTLSREMVRQLARDNEAYLRDGGHSITAGRLYLAHFLGAEGANRVLKADDTATVLAIMGADVVRANAFLTNYTIADLEAWADRKMHGRGAAPAAVVAPAPPPPEIAAFVALVDDVLANAPG